MMTTKPKAKPVRAWGVFISGELYTSCNSLSVYGYEGPAVFTHEADARSFNLDVRPVEIREIPRKRK